MKTVKLFILLATVLFVSCGKSGKGVSVKVENFSNGKAGEVIVVADDAYWPALADTVTARLQQPQPAINQIEPMFDILRFAYKDFSKQFQRHRNIVHFDINPSYPQNVFVMEKDKWASPQIYVHIKGNSADSCLLLFENHFQDIVKSLYDNDLKRNQKFFAANAEAGVEKRIKDKFGIRLTVPNTYFIANDTTDFLWLRYRTARNDRFIMIYKTPATELTRENMIAARNSITRAFIPGAVKGAYPIVAETMGFPLAEISEVNGKKGLALRGLWESVNDKMGGPFFSFSYLTEDERFVVTVDGFVYAPEEDKRDYLREVESIVKTVK